MKRIFGVEDRGLRIIAGRVAVSAGTPSVAYGSGFSVVDVAAGQVKIVFEHPAKSIISAQCTVSQGTDATGYSAKIDARTEATDVTFGIYVADGVDGALADNVDFDFLILVKDVRL